MQHIGSFVVHIAAALGSDTVPSDNGPVIFNVGSRSANISSGIGFVEIVLCKKRLRIGSKALVNPHIRFVRGGDAVCEPFVTAFVDDDEIPLQTHTGSG